MKKYWLETYGCQMNKAESNALENFLQEGGWSSAESDKEADMVVINTCSVRQTAENRIWGRLGYYKHLKEDHPFHLVLMGCMAQNIKEDIKKKVPAVDHIVGSFEKGDFLRYVDQGFPINGHRDFLNEDEYSFFTNHSSSGNQAFLPIMNGCNNFCTYCIVPYVRGREISRDPDSILEEISLLETKGVKELTLLGQNVNSYIYTKNGKTTNFAELLEIITEKVNHIKWIRIMSSHPKDISPDVMKILATNSLFCNNLHLPVQHGSDHVLGMMKRKYTVEYYKGLIKQIRSINSNFTFSTDIMVGFPGETEEDFLQLLEFMKEIKFYDAFTYYYNERTGTAAASFPNQIGEEVKHERLDRLIKLQNSISKEERKKQIGKIENVLVESVSKKNPNELLGRTQRNEMVIFTGEKNKIGEFIQIRLESLSGQTFKGKEV